LAAAFVDFDKTCGLRLEPALREARIETLCVVANGLDVEHDSPEEVNFSGIWEAVRGESALRPPGPLVAHCIGGKARSVQTRASERDGISPLPLPAPTLPFSSPSS